MPEERVNRLEPKNLALEDHPAVARDGFADRVQVKLVPELLLHGSDRLCADAAGDDQVEIAEFGVDIQSEAVRGDAAGDMNSDGRKLGFGGCRGWLGRASRWTSLRAGFRPRPSRRVAGFGIGPDAGEAGDAPGGDGKVGAGAHQDFFKAADKFNHAQGFAPAGGRGESAEIEDGIADDLSGTVESD